jgi:hypothetical protein
MNPSHYDGTVGLQWLLSREVSKRQRGEKEYPKTLNQAHIARLYK